MPVFSGEARRWWGHVWDLDWLGNLAGNELFCKPKYCRLTCEAKPLEPNRFINRTSPNQTVNLQQNNQKKWASQSPDLIEPQLSEVMLEIGMIQNSSSMIWETYKIRNKRLLPVMAARHGYASCYIRTFRNDWGFDFCLSSWLFMFSTGCSACLRSFLLEINFILICLTESNNLHFHS